MTHQASNVAIQLHIVEVVTGGINLPRVQLRGVLHVEDGLREAHVSDQGLIKTKQIHLLPERGVVIKAKLGIGGVYLNDGNIATFCLSVLEDHLQAKSVLRQICNWLFSYE